MESFNDLNLSKQLKNALAEMGLEQPTPIQSEAFSVVLSGKNVVGIAQTGTGKTLAYLLPLLRDLKYSKENHPRILVLVPTRELVDQVVEQVEKLTEYMSVSVFGVYGGTNIRTQRQRVASGGDILVATPGRLYDLVLDKTIRLKQVKKVVIDEVDVMLALGFRYQLVNIFDHLPTKRQNLLFSATMTEDIDDLISDFFIAPARISIAVSGTPLGNIEQKAYPVKNYYTKVNLLNHMLDDRNSYTKVLVFVSTKKIANRLYEAVLEEFGPEIGVIHGNKSQNFRTKAIEAFDTGEQRVLIATDVMARGLDFDKVTHVFNFDAPTYPENYMHRIGRTGRAEEAGTAILFFTEKELPYKEAVETLMDTEIPLVEFPEEVKIENQLAPEERPTMPEPTTSRHTKEDPNKGAAFHEKKEKNKKVNLGGGAHKRKLQAKYNKPKKRGDKFAKKKKGKRR